MKFMEELEKLIDRFLEGSDDREQAIEEVMTELELKLDALREEEDDA